VPLTRKGYGLVELVVATAVTGVMASITASILTRSATHVRNRRARAAAEHVVRVASGAVRGLLQDGVSGEDLAMATPTGFTVRVTRGTGVVCGWSASGVVVRQGLPWWKAVREPVAGRDTLLIGRLTEPGWHAVALRSDPTPTLCPDGAAGLALPAALNGVASDALGPGSPLRFFEPVELRIYSSSASDWIGVRLAATGEAIQPLAGPIARAGTGFEYFTADGRETALASEAAAVGFRIEAVVESAGAKDSARGFVGLRGSR